VTLVEVLTEQWRLVRSPTMTIAPSALTLLLVNSDAFDAAKSVWRCIQSSTVKSPSPKAIPSPGSSARPPALVSLIAPQRGTHWPCSQRGVPSPQELRQLPQNCALARVSTSQPSSAR
jgi:hypothetical protein